VGRVSGGGARSELWRRIVASVLDLPLERTAAEEGSAFGAALLAGFADPREAVTRCVRVRDRVDPNPEWSAVYAEGYGQFLELYPKLKGR
jgi:xylulokinase